MKINLFTKKVDFADVKENSNVIERIAESYFFTDILYKTRGML